MPATRSKYANRFFYRVFYFLIGVFVSFYSQNTYAEVNHELHLGIGVGGQHLPHYRGSRETHTRALPIPVVEYKGRILKSDRDGTRAEFSLSERMEFSISADLALNDGAEDNRLRQGMPELESEFQLGPSLNIDLTGNGFNRGLILRLPIRPVITIGSDVDYIGYTFNPVVTWIKPNVFNHWRISLDLGALYASQDYHEHYYSVTSEYVTALRPEYFAKSGFSGIFSELGISSRHKNFFYGISFRYDNLSDAVFYKSPLVETDNYWSISFGMGWFLKSWHWKE